MIEPEDNLNDLQFKIRTCSTNITNLNSNIQNNKLLFNELENDSKVLIGSKELLEVLKDTKMNSKKEFILETINTALLDIFNEDLKIDIENEATDNNGKIQIKYNIVLYQNNIEMARNEKLLSNNGGGVLSVVSILFKMIVGYIYSDNKFYMFDESVSQVSAEYRPSLGKFLQKFCETYKFTMILVNHNSDMDEFADLTYYLNAKYDDKNIPELFIESINGKIPNTNYYNIEIENFQSIKKLSFKYTGLTIIRGKSNIGKSASLRAVTSLLFNTFDVKDYPRKLRKKGSPVSISFEYIEDDATYDASKSIKLSYKNNKVIYTFDGNDFVGKNLAFEKVKEKVQSIGFKYIDISKTYKNFKGNLKDQTERLAATTQHDSFYLVGNKSNEIEKVFNFLFDTYKISGAITLIKSDIMDIQNKMNELNLQISGDSLKLKKENLLLQILNKKYMLLYISNYSLNLKEYQKCELKINKYSECILKYNNTIQIYEYFLNYDHNLKMIESFNINIINSKINIISQLLPKLELSNLYKKYTLKYNLFTNVSQSLNNIKLKIDIITKVISKIEVVNYIKGYLSNTTSLNTIYSYIEIINNKKNIIENIIQKYSVLSIKNYIQSFSDNLIKSNDISSYLLSINDKTNIINQLIIKFENFRSLDTTKLIQNLNNLSVVQQTIQNYDNLIVELNESYDMCTCPNCHGKGVVIGNH